VIHIPVSAVLDESLYRACALQCTQKFNNMYMYMKKVSIILAESYCKKTKAFKIMSYHNCMINNLLYNYIQDIFLFSQTISVCIYRLNNDKKK